MIRNRYVVLGAAFLSLGLHGALLSSIGASLPAIQEFFGTDIGQTGRISALFQLGYALFCFLGGILIDVFGRNRVLTAGAILYGGCALLIGVPAAFPANLLLFALAGVAGGLLFIGANTLVVQLFPERRGTFLNLLHLCFSIASILAPLLTSVLLSAGRRWDAVYHLLSGGAFLVALFFLFAKTGVPAAGPAVDGTAPAAPASNPDPLSLQDDVSAGGSPAAHRPHRRALSAAQRLFGKYHRMLQDRRFLTLLVANTLAIATQFATIYLMTLFMTRTRGMAIPAASLLLAAHFILTGVGRLACSALIARQPITRIVTVLLILLAASLLGGWLTRGTLSMTCFALTGLACSGLMPSLLALASHLLPAEVSGSAIGLLSMFGGVGGMALTWLTAWIAGTIGLNLAFLAVILVAFAALGYFALMRSRFQAVEERRG